MRNVNTVGPMAQICFGALGIIVMNTFPLLFFSLSLQYHCSRSLRRWSFCLGTLQY